jgi:hypothetical protein
MDGEVFLLWHVHHAAHDDGRVDHLDESGEVRVEEEFGDSVKLLGVYSSHRSASGRMDSAKSLPGFSDEPNCFILSKYKIDDDQWVEGFQAVQLEA